MESALLKPSGDFSQLFLQKPFLAKFVLQTALPCLIVLQFGRQLLLLFPEPEMESGEVNGHMAESKGTKPNPETFHAVESRRFRGKKIAPTRKTSFT